MKYESIILAVTIFSTCAFAACEPNSEKLPCLLKALNDAEIKCAPGTPYWPDCLPDDFPSPIKDPAPEGDCIPGSKVWPECTMIEKKLESMKENFLDCHPGKRGYPDCLLFKATEKESSLSSGCTPSHPDWPDCVPCPPHFPGCHL